MNNEKLYALAGGINDDFVAETMKPKAARPRYLRYIAAAAAVLLVLGAAFGVVKAAGEKGAIEMNNKWANLPEGYEFMADTTVPEEAIQPKNISYRGDPSYARSYTFREAYLEAYAVCAVSIGDYIGQNGWSTDFTASVEKVYKGELPEEITVCQYVHGNKPTPYQYGDKLLLFLRESHREGYTNAYEVVGADIAQLYLAAANDGSVYAIDFYGLLSLETHERDKDFCPKNLSELIVDGYPDPLNAERSAEGKALASELAAYIALTDPGFDGAYMCYFYRIEDIEELFSELE